MKVNIFCRPEEAILENWQKLVSNKNIFCFKRKSGHSSIKLHCIWYRVLLNTPGLKIKGQV